jgi:hypothetical protein
MGPTMNPELTLHALMLRAKLDRAHQANDQESVAHLTVMLTEVIADNQ